METRAGALRAGLLALVGTTAAMAVLLLSAATPSPEPLAWLSEELGAPAASAPLKRQVADRTWVALGGAGFELEKGTSQLSLATKNIVGAGPWQRHAGGVTRTTPFGAETITVSPRKTELYLLVEQRQGKRTWRWSLDTTLEPSLTATGAVLLEGRAGDSISINPFAVYDSAGRDVTPAGAGFGLERGERGWELTATVDDSSLALPYAVDPGINNTAPAPYRELVIADGAVDYFRLGEAAAATTAVNEIAGRTNGTYEGTPTLGGASSGLINDSDTAAVFDNTNQRVALGTVATPTSIEAWISHPFGNVQDSIFSNGIDFGITSGSPFIYNVSNGNYLDTSPFRIDDGQPHYVVYTSDAGIGRIYIDGILRKSGAFTPPGTAAPAYIGFDGAISPGGGRFDGTIDEVATYSTTLSCTGAAVAGDACTGGQVKTHYDRGRDFGLTLSDNSVRQHPTPLAAGATARPTLFYNPSTPTNGDTFTVASNAADVQDVPQPDDITGVTFGAVANATGAGTVLNPGPYTKTYTWAGAQLGGTQNPTVAIENASPGPNETSTGKYTVAADSTPTTGGTISYAPGYAAGGTVAITTTNATSDDLSGVAPSAIQRQTVALSGNVCGAFPAWPTGATTVTSPDSVPTGQCARYRLRTADNVDNAAFVDPIGDPVVKVDTTVPSSPLTVAEVANDPDSHVSGTTLFYRPGGGRSGSFTVDAAATDAESGIEKVNFPAVGSGVARTAPGGNGDDTAPTPYQGSYDWASSATATGAQTVTATNNAGGTATPSFTLTADSDLPSGGSATATGLVGTGVAYDTDGTLALTLANGTDGGSGIDATTESLQRFEAPLSSAGGTANGACGTFVADGAPVVNPALSYSDSTSIESGKCYRYTYTVFDNVGNAAVYTSADIKVDTSVPAVAVATVNETAGAGDQFYNGSGTHFFRPAGAGSFTIDATSSDGQSGTDSVTFPSTSATGWSATGGGIDNTATGTTYASNTFTWGAGAADPAEPLTLTAINHATLTATTGITITADSGVPTGGTISVPAFSGSLSGITITTGNYSDAGSGIASNTITRSAGQAPTSPGVCPGTGYSGTTVVTSPDTVPTTGLCYVYTLTGTDNVGNSAFVTSSPILVDTTAPSAPGLSASDAGNDSHVAGSVFLRTLADGTEAASSGGSFTVDATTADNESGIQKVDFPSLGTGYTGGGPDTAAAYSSTYTWTNAVAAVPSATVTATNNAAGTSSSAFVVALDNDNPTGTAIACNGGGCGSTFGSSVSVTLAGATDGSGSGVREIRYTTDGSTPSATVGTIYSGAFTVAATATVKFRAIDNVSNEEALGAQTITIDTAKPTLSSASTAGSTLTLTFNESLASSSTPGSAFVLSRTGSTSISGTGTANVSGTGVTVTLASAPPAGQTGWTLAYSKPGGANNLRDSVGNEADPISGFSVATGSDTTAPDTTIDSGPSGSVSSTGATFAFSSSEPGSTFQCKLDAGAFAACTTPASYTGLASGSHTFEVRATDPASNQDATPASRTWTVDTTAPTTSVGSGPAEGSSTTATSATFGFTADESGTTFECKLDGGAFAPCTSPQTYTGLAVGSHTFQVRATDAAGNLGGVTSRTWTVTSAPPADTTPPTTTIDSGPSGSTTATGATFAFSANESATFECRLDGAAFAGCTSPKSYTGLAVGSHTFDVRGTDASANTGAAASRTWTITATAPGPDSAPELASSTPADGATVPSISSLTLTASEPVVWSSVTVTHENGTVTPLAGTVTATTSITRAFGPSTQGLHTIRATLGDGVNASVPVTAHFTIWVGSAGADAPPSEINAGGNKSFEVTASNGIASVEVPAGATSDSIVLRIDPSPSTTTASGFSIGSDRLEVTARRTSDGSPVTTFTQPLDIEFPNASADAIPQRSQDGGAYNPIMLTFSHDLPATRDDAYFRDASGTIHILTRHLTFFAIFRDIQSPTAPRSLVGVVAGDGLTLRWEPATDNSEITGYVLLVDGAVVRVFGAQTFEAKLGLFTAGDTRTFSIQARDAAGRLGPTTGGVRGVPSLIGLTLEQATAALAARGFSLGSVSSGPGAAATATISGQTPSAPGTGLVGSTVNVVVGAVPGQARLVLKVASPKRISLADRKWIGVRVTVSARSKIVGELVSSNGRIIQRYTARSVPSGASTLRFALPAGKITATDRYRLHLRATASNQSAARTARVQIVPGVLKARFTPAKKPIGVAVIDGSIKGLNLGSSFRINHVDPSLAFDVIGLHPAFVEAAVVDMSVVSKGFIRSLRQVFPELQILALAPTSEAAGQARVEGASIALVKPVPTARIAALLRRTLGR